MAFVKSAEIKEAPTQKVHLSCLEVVGVKPAGEKSDANIFTIF